MSKTLTTASVLAFERKLDISDAYLWQMIGDKQESKTPVIVREKSVRGTISNRLKATIANNPAKIDAEIEKANLQRVDAAFLEDGYDTLVATFTCKVLAFSGKPNICNNQDYQKRLEETIYEYQQIDQYYELAKRYAINLANARWLWRNRLGAETITVTIINGDEQVVFNNARTLSLNSFDQQSAELDKLTSWIQAGLNGEVFTLLHVEAKAKIGNAQEVFPSQELVLDTGKDKSKILYTVGKEQNQAGIHSQKIGNAIRTIDTWYPEAEFPIAVEPYGAVTSLGTAYRQPKEKQDFYSLFDAWITKNEKPEVNQQHYIAAVLIRGGVFGESGKE